LPTKQVYNVVLKTGKYRYRKQFNKYTFDNISKLGLLASL